MLPGVAYHGAICNEYVRYEKIVSATKNKRLLGFYRKYTTFKSKE